MTPKKTVVRNKAGGHRLQPPKPFKHFQVVEVRAGREWTLYVLDANGELWCRYWIEKSYNRRTRYLEGSWGRWRRLADDDLA